MSADKILLRSSRNEADVRLSSKAKILHRLLRWLPLTCLKFLGFSFQFESLKAFRGYSLNALKTTLIRVTFDPL